MTTTMIEPPVQQQPVTLPNSPPGLDPARSVASILPGTVDCDGAKISWKGCPHGAELAVRAISTACRDKLAAAEKAAGAAVRDGLQAIVDAHPQTAEHKEYDRLRQKTQEVEADLFAVVAGLPDVRERAARAIANGTDPKKPERELDDLLTRQRRAAEVLPRLRELRDDAHKAALVALRVRVAAKAAEARAAGRHEQELNALKASADAVVDLMTKLRVIRATNVAANSVDVKTWVEKGREL